MILAKRHVYSRRAWPGALLAALTACLATAWPAAYDQSGFWTTATLSQPRSSLAATAVGSKALFAGGGSDTVDIYDSATDQWTAAYLSQARFGVVGVSVGTQALFGGGISDPQMIDYSKVSDVVDIYDSVTDQWSTATFSEARTDLGVTSVGTKAIFAGGITRPDESRRARDSAAVDIYDSATGEWTTAVLSQARVGPVAATVGTKALFAGGWSAAAATWEFDAVDIYDSVSGEWTHHRLSIGRPVWAGVTAGSKALFVGHRIPGLLARDVVDIYDSVTDQWSTATLSQPRVWPSATAIGTKAFFAGGHAEGSDSDVVDIYDSATNQWTTARLSGGRRIHAATTVDTLALFAGDSLVDIYDVATDQWSTAALSQRRGGLIATSAGSTALFAGGITSSDTGQHASDVVDLYRAARGQ